MANQQARIKHRTIVQMAKLCLQSAEDYYKQYSHKVPNSYCRGPQHERELG